jgi:hypothetical protein
MWLEKTRVALAVAVTVTVLVSPPAHLSAPEPDTFVTAILSGNT